MVAALPLAVKIELSKFGITEYVCAERLLK